MKKIVTLDGYVYTIIYRQPTTMNTMVVYKIQKGKENPVYFLASSEMKEWLIKRCTFNQMKTHTAPQHYEGFFDNKFTAILMAKNVALECCVSSQKYTLEKAQEALAQATEDIKKIQASFSLEDIYKQYYDAQEELRRAALQREKEDENK